MQLANLALLVLHGGLGLLLGLGPVALVLLAVMVPASIVGVWLFSLQHHFEGAHWARHAEWDPVAAAIGGSSFLRLPRVLQWLTGSIGFHHVHHLAPRIPNYRLEACHRAHPAFAGARVLTLREGLRASRYMLWDEAVGRMVTFAEAEEALRARGGCTVAAGLSRGGLLAFGRARSPTAAAVPTARSRYPCRAPREAHAACPTSPPPSPTP